MKAARRQAAIGQQHPLEEDAAERRGRKLGGSRIRAHGPAKIGQADGVAKPSCVIPGREICRARRASLHLRRMRRVSKREVEEFYRRLAASRPIPQTELEFINPFTLLVAVVLSAQATDVGVNKETPALFALADTPAQMLKLGEERVAALIRTIGLYRTKAKNVVALSRILVEKHAGQVP